MLIATSAVKRETPMRRCRIATSASGGWRIASAWLGKDEVADEWACFVCARQQLSYRDLRVGTTDFPSGAWTHRVFRAEESGNWEYRPTPPRRRQRSSQIVFPSRNPLDDGLFPGQQRYSCKAKRSLAGFHLSERSIVEQLKKG